VALNVPPEMEKPAPITRAPGAALAVPVFAKKDPAGIGAKLIVLPLTTSPVPAAAPVELLSWVQPIAVVPMVTVPVAVQSHREFASDAPYCSTATKAPSNSADDCMDVSRVSTQGVETDPACVTM